VMGGRPAFAARVVLAATLSASYGIYGPAFELAERVPAAPGSEDYLNSEKYELKRWDIDRADSLRPLITRLNEIRRGHVALQANERLRFHPTDDERIICYSKRTENARNIIVSAVNLDPRRARSTTIELPLEDWGIDLRRSVAVEELLSGEEFKWRGRRQHVRLDPRVAPAAIFRLRGDATVGSEELA